jgi:hypothetical protein
MTFETFNEIMLKLDKRMRKQNWNILVFLDNCASHPFLNLNNIKLLFLPPNTTSLLQPLDAGIIRSFKNVWGLLYQNFERFFLLIFDKRIFKILRSKGLQYYWH